VDDIRAEGRIRNPLIVRKNGMFRGKPIIEIIEGRNRKKSVDIVNPERKKAGLPEILLPCMYQRLDDVQAMDEMIATNQLRKVEDHVTVAKRIERWLKFNAGDEKRARRVFGLSAADMRTALSVLDMDPALQKALKDKRVTLANAKHLSTLPRDKQRQALDQLLAEVSAARGQAAKDAVEQKTRDSRPRVQSFKRVEMALDTAACMPVSDYQKGVLHALEWMMGRREAAWAGDKGAPK